MRQTGRTRATKQFFFTEIYKCNRTPAEWLFALILRYSYLLFFSYVNYDNWSSYIWRK